MCSFLAQRVFCSKERKDKKRVKRVLQWSKKLFIRVKNHQLIMFVFSLTQGGWLESKITSSKVKVSSTSNKIAKVLMFIMTSQFSKLMKQFKLEKMHISKTHEFSRKHEFSLNSNTKFKNLGVQTNFDTRSHLDKNTSVTFSGL